jgi:hypothetical protein
MAIPAEFGGGERTLTQNGFQIAFEFISEIGYEIY